MKTPRFRSSLHLGPAALSLSFFFPMNAELLAAQSASQEALDQLLGYIKEGRITIALDRYNQIELSGRFDIFDRHRIHENLLGELKKSKDPSLKDLARRLFRSSSSTSFPAQVLLMKALLGNRFPASKIQRIDWLADLVTGRNEGLSIWAVHLLANSRWPEAIDKLIEILQKEENAGKTDSLLYSVLFSDLYRMMGVQALGTAEEIGKNWNDMNRKLPGNPDYRLELTGRITSSFFGDRISPQSVFGIDISTSMRQQATVRPARPGPTTTDKKKRGQAQKKPKVEIVKEELIQAVRSLRPWCKFNILAYNATNFPWKSSGGPKLYPANSTAVKSALEFTENLVVAPGTNIHDCMAAALMIPEVETVYLLSDGSPSRGGGPPEIELRVAAMNYLRGIRVVTYGFTPEEGGSFDEEFMKRLARNNWGWYRRLN